MDGEFGASLVGVVGALKLGLKTLESARFEDVPGGEKPERRFAWGRGSRESTSSD